MLILDRLFFHPKYLLYFKRYDNVVPKWYSMALGSAVGLNRLFLMANFIEPQLNWDELDEQTLSRQVSF